MMGPAELWFLPSPLYELFKAEPAAVSLKLRQFPSGVFMLSTTPLLCALSLAALAYGHPGTSDDRATLGATSQFKTTCHRIVAAISNASEVFFSRVSRVLAHS